MRFLLCALLMACSERHAAVDAGESWDSVPAAPSPRGMRADSVLAAEGNDTVLVTLNDSGRVLIWTSVEGTSSVARYRSGDVFGGVPHVELTDLDDDGLLDLFVAWQYEEQASGVLLRARPGLGSEMLYRSAGDICTAPALSDSIEQGRVHVIEYLPGAVTMADCREGGPLAECVEDYAVEWPRVLSLNREHRVLGVDTSAAVAGFYAVAASRYAESLRRMRARLASDPKSACDLALIGRVEEQRMRARRLADMR